MICSCVPVLFGLSGVMLVMLSVIALVVFFSAVGVKSTLVIMEVIPFFVLAVSFVLPCNKISTDFRIFVSYKVTQL